MGGPAFARRPHILERDSRWTDGIRGADQPRTYDALDAPAGTTVTLTVDAEPSGEDRGESASLGTWSLERRSDGWRLWGGATDAPTTVVRLSADDSWRLLYNARSPEAARESATITGESRWTEPLWRTRSATVREPEP